MAGRPGQSEERQYIVFSHSCSEEKIQDDFSNAAELVLDIRQGRHYTDPKFNLSPENIKKEHQLLLANKVNAYIQDFEHISSQPTYAYILTTTEKVRPYNISNIDNSTYRRFIFPLYNPNQFTKFAMKRAKHLENPSLLKPQRDNIIQHKIAELKEDIKSNLKWSSPDSSNRSQYSQNPKRGLKGFFAGGGVGAFVALAIGFSIPVIGPIATIAICAIAGAIGFMYSGSKLDDHRLKQSQKEFLAAGEDPEIGLSFHGSCEKRTFSEQAELKTVKLTKSHVREPSNIRSAITPLSQAVSTSSIETVASQGIDEDVATTVVMPKAKPKPKLTIIVTPHSPAKYAEPTFKGAFQVYNEPEAQRKCYQEPQFGHSTRRAISA